MAHQGNPAQINGTYGPVLFTNRQYHGWIIQFRLPVRLIDNHRIRNHCPANLFVVGNHLSGRNHKAKIHLEWLVQEILGHLQSCAGIATLAPFHFGGYISDPTKFTCSLPTFAVRTIIWILLTISSSLDHHRPVWTGPFCACQVSIQGTGYHTILASFFERAPLFSRFDFHSHGSLRINKKYKLYKQSQIWLAEIWAQSQ